MVGTGVLRGLVVFSVVLAFAEMIFAASEESTPPAMAILTVGFVAVASIAYGRQRPALSSLLRAVLTMFVTVSAAEIVSRVAGIAGDGALSPTVNLLALPLLVGLVTVGIAIGRRRDRVVIMEV